MKNDGGAALQSGDVFDIHQTVNGQALFYVKSLDPLDIRYNYDRSRKYEYSITELLAPDHWTGEPTFTILLAERAKGER